MRTGPWALVWALIFGCAAPTPEKVASSPEVRPPPVAPPEDKVSPPSLAKTPQQRYQHAWVTTFAQTRRARTIQQIESSEGKPPHTIVVLKRTGPQRRNGLWVITSGVGLYRRSDSAVPSGERHVELLARVPKYEPGVAAVLSKLAERVTASKTVGTILKSYDAVALDAPVFGLQYFDLLPGGELDVGERHIMLYKVLPITKEEFETIRSDSGSQWAGADLADPARKGQVLERWRPVFEAGAISEKP